MTSDTPKARKPQTPRRKATSAQDDVALKSAVLHAALAHVAFDGFTDAVLTRAGADSGADRDTVSRLFPKGPLSLVEVFSEDADADMERRMAKAKLPSMKVRERIGFAVRSRIEALKPHKEAARRAAAFLTLPPNAPTAARLLCRTVDAIWRAAGDTSTDFNFYSKRAILAGVYSTTLVRWFNDSSDDESATHEFLDRRIENVMQFERLKADIRERAKTWPSLSEILNGRSARRT